MKSKLLSAGDWLGAGLSGLCMVHCLALPLLALLFAIQLPGVLVGESVHGVLLFLVLPTALTVLGLGFRQHRRLTVLLLGAAGIAVMLSAHALAGLWGESAEKIATLTGSVTLVWAHLLNYKARSAP